MPETYAKVSTPGDWTGELDRHPCQQVLLHMNYWKETNKSTQVMVDSSGKNRHGKVLGWGSSSGEVGSKWGSALSLNKGVKGYVPYSRGLWPLNHQGSFLVGCWVSCNWPVGMVDIFTTQDFGYTRGRFFKMYARRVDASSKTYLQADLYDKNDDSFAWLNVSNRDLPANSWVWVGLEINFDKRSATLWSYGQTGWVGSATRENLDLTKLDPDPICPLMIGGISSTPIAYDEVVVYHPVPQDIDVSVVALAGAEATGASNPTPVTIVRPEIDAKEPGTADSHDESAGIGRIAPSENMKIPGEIITRWVPLSPKVRQINGGLVVTNGKDVEVSYRTTHNVAQYFANLPWLRQVDEKGRLVISGVPQWDKYIQFKIKFLKGSAYLDGIYVTSTHNNNNFTENDLPRSRAVPGFSQSPVIVDTTSGGVILDEELIGCVTVDTDEMESTLEFDLPLYHEKSGEIQIERPVHFREREYVVRGITTQDSAFEPKLKVYCERLWYDLLYAGQINTRSWNVSPEECALIMLAGTDWGCGRIEDPESGPHHWTLTEPTTILGGLKALAKQYHLELSLDDKHKMVHLLKRAGRDSGVTAMYHKDVATVRRRLDTTSLVTRIYGVDELGGDISPVNNGVPYLEDTTWTTAKRQAVYNFSGVQSPSAMKNFLQTYLNARSKPYISYEFDLVALQERVSPEETFEVFDQISILDENLRQIVRTQVVEMRMDWCSPDASKVVLSNKLRTLGTTI